MISVFFGKTVVEDYSSSPGKAWQVVGAGEGVDWSLC